MNPSTNRSAQCACSKLSAAVRGEPIDVYGCSCLACQRKSGSAFTYAAMFPESAVMITGAHTPWRHNGDSGRWIENLFCPTCGVTVAFRCEAAPSLIGIPVGAFADPGFEKPRRFYWSSRRYRWLALPDDVECMETQ